MPPYFGPLSAELPELKDLTKDEALVIIRGHIRRTVHQIAPAMPEFHLPHKRNHRETGPWLWIGTGGQLDAGRWYQVCKTCDGPVIVHYITDPLDSHLITGKSALGRLFDIYYEIKNHPDVIKTLPAPATRGTKRKRSEISPSIAPRSVKERHPNSNLVKAPCSKPSSSGLRAPAPFPMPSPLREFFD
ncbi:hypothetical protein BDZ97DRAFT_1926291 [Flammula alnicola]|nr:hypothetical protein BDZ97DRAFT_1926291 [Flammula alnicola]